MAEWCFDHSFIHPPARSYFMVGSQNSAFVYLVSASAFRTGWVRKFSTDDESKKHNCPDFVVCLLGLGDTAFELSLSGTVGFLSDSW
jgi:hypothetical protein